MTYIKILIYRYQDLRMYTSSMMNTHQDRMYQDPYNNDKMRMRMYTAVSRKVVQLKSIKAYATIPKGIMVWGSSYPPNSIKMRMHVYIMYIYQNMYMYMYIYQNKYIKILI